MSKKVVRGVLKASVIATTILFGFVLTAQDIMVANKTAISQALGQGVTSIAGKDPTVKHYKSDYNSIAELKVDTKALSKEIESEGIVMLENKNNALPLKEGAKITAFGNKTNFPYYGGRGSSDSGSGKDIVDFYQGLDKAGIIVNPTIKKYYDDCKSSVGEFTEIPFTKSANGKYYPAISKQFGFIGDKKELTDSVSEYGDAAIYMIARTGGEASDLAFEKNAEGKITKNDLALTIEEKSVIKGMSDLKKAGKVDKVIVLLNMTNQIPQQEFNRKEFDIDAILNIGHPGINGFEAVGEVLTGKVNPSGKLYDTFWWKHTDNPVMANINRTYYENRSEFNGVLPEQTGTDPYGSYVAYQEGVYLGYRYAETRYFDKVMGNPNVGDFKYNWTIYKPFGFGMSYSTFKFDNFNVEKGNHEYTVNVDVTNTSDVPGKEVVQVYVNKPYTELDQERGIEKPAVELVGFEKTKLLNGGEKQTVSIKVDEKSFTSYDANFAKTYVLSEGDYKLTVASDAHEATNNILAYNGKGESNGMIGEGNKNFVASYAYDYDDQTYRFTEVDGEQVEIKNLFDQYNMNKNSHKGDNKIDFLSRSNWSKSLEKKMKLNNDLANDLLNQQDPTKLIKPDDGKYPAYGKIPAEGKMLLIQLFEDDFGEIGKKRIDYNDPRWEKFLDQLSWDDTVALVREGLRKTAELAEFGKPETFDHNGPTGLTQKYSEGDGLAKEKNDPDKNDKPIRYPSVPVLAATFNKDLAAKYGHMLGEDALWAGYQGFYGVGLNSHRSPYEGRHFEYWSEDPLLAGLMATEQVKALQEKGCNAYIKHFALNDQETQRFGIQVWSNEQALREISLRPFELAVVKGGAMNAMAAFSRIGTDFAPASKALQTDYLRGELGMKGVVVTDMYTLGYEPAQYINFLMAGTSIPDGSVDASLFDAYKTGHSEVAWKMREAAHHILYHTVQSNAMNGFTLTTTVSSVTPPWLVGVYSAVGVISALFGASVIWLGVTLVLDNKEKLLKLIKRG